MAYQAWASRAGARQQTSENLETHEVTNLAGRFSLDLLRALVCHQVRSSYFLLAPTSYFLPSTSD